MKKRFIAMLLSAICMISPMSANAADLGVDAEFVYMTDTFTYRTNNIYGSHDGFFLETELADPDFMVVGYLQDEYCPGTLYAYVVSPINDDYLLKGGVGIMEASIVERELGDQQLRIGDLLKIDGQIAAAEPSTLIYFPAEEGTMSCLGNGVDILGCDFQRIIRLQLVIDQAAFDNQPNMFGINLIHGDVNVDDEMNVLDCIVLNRHLLGGASLCDYAKLAADINENGTPDGDDALSIMKEIVGLTENFE